MTGNPGEWTAEERERARTLVATDARTLTNKPNYERVVSPSECERWRREVKGEGGSPARVDAEFNTSTVEQHVQGECQHDPAEVGVPARFDNDRGEWVACRVISAGAEPHQLRVYHTRVCKVFPDSVRVLDGLDCERQKWRECRECSGRVPEAKPIPEG